MKRMISAVAVLLFIAAAAPVFALDADPHRRSTATIVDEVIRMSQAGVAGPLAADDVERLAWSAILTGRDESALEAFERLHQLGLDAGENFRAARAALWLALRSMSLRFESEMSLITRNEPASKSAVIPSSSPMSTDNLVPFRVASWPKELAMLDLV